MKELKIITMSGKVFTINNTGQIKVDSAFSKAWTIKGITHVKKNWFIPFNELTSKTIGNIPLLYKNGRPQFTIVDIDHGTTRVHGNGIAQIILNN